MNALPISAANSNLALIVVGIIVFIVLLYFSNQHEKRLALAWSGVAAKYGLDQVAKFELAGQVEGLTVGAEIYTTGSGKSRKTWTKVTVEGDLTRAVALAAEGFFSRVFGQDIALGDAAFDQAVKVQGDEAAALALLDEQTREAFQSAVGSGWSFEDGRWSLKVSGRLGEELGSRIEVGLSLARLTRKGQSELPQRLLALVTRDSLSGVRRRALSYLISQYANAPVTGKALEAALQDAEPAVRLIAAQRLGELEVLSHLAADEAVEAPLRVEALEAMVRHGQDDPRTRERVSSWLDAEAQLFRKAAIEAAASVEVPRIEERLVQALSSPDDALRLAAIRSLGVVGTVKVVPALIPFRDKLLAFALKGAAKEAILSIQARVAGGDAGALSLAGEGGGLAVAEADEE